MEGTNENLIRALSFLQQIVEKRLQDFFNKKRRKNTPISFPPLKLEDSKDSLFRFIQYYKLSTEECIAFLVGLVPHILPNFFEAIIASFLPKGGEFSEFGGLKSEQRRTMLPTGETLLFILAGTNIEQRVRLQTILSNEHFFSREKILYLDQVKIGEPLLGGKLILDQEYIDLFTTGNISIPKLSTSFPAQYISTEMDWEDLVLNDQTFSQIKELENWVNYNATLMEDWGMHKKLKPGYRALFYGPPGTGKTLTATLLGKYTNRPVFKIDLSMVVSKYIGETEKNLANLFDKAKYKNWILFFDEADSIFGKRTNVRDAHDKYANQEVSYLLQRIENYPGLTILASNFKNNIDDAFMRRFQAVVYFPIPSSTERLNLWNKSFPENISFDQSVKIPQIAERYELTGASIMNVVQYCCIEALANGIKEINLADIRKGISREYAKEGRII